MEPMQLVQLIALVVVFGGTLLGFFFTKEHGWGRWGTSTLIVILVLFVTAFTFLMGKLGLEPLVNILFAVAGYAGGLLSGERAAGTSN